MTGWPLETTKGSNWDCSKMSSPNSLKSTFTGRNTFINFFWKIFEFNYLKLSVFVFDSFLRGGHVEGDVMLAFIYNLSLMYICLYPVLIQKEPYFFYFFF